MNAIQLMLKSFGFDPVEVMENVKNMGMMITQMYESQQRTEELLKKLHEKYDAEHRQYLGSSPEHGPGIPLGHGSRKNGTVEG